MAGVLSALRVAETPGEARKVGNQERDRLDQEHPGKAHDGMVEHLVKAVQDDLKAKNVTPRSAEETRADWILRTRDSSGKAKPRRFMRNAWSDTAREAARASREAERLGRGDAAEDAASASRKALAEPSFANHAAAVDAHAAAAEATGDPRAQRAHEAAAQAHDDAAMEIHGEKGKMGRNSANFASEKQRKLMWSQHPDIAESWAHGQHTSDKDHRMPSGPGKDVKGPQAKAARHERAEKWHRARGNHEQADAHAAQAKAIRSAIATVNAFCASEATGEVTLARVALYNAAEGEDPAHDHRAAAAKHEALGHNAAAEAHREAAMAWNAAQQKRDKSSGQFKSGFGKDDDPKDHKDKDEDAVAALMGLGAYNAWTDEAREAARAARGAAVKAKLASSEAHEASGATSSGSPSGAHAKKLSEGANAMAQAGYSAAAHAGHQAAFEEHQEAGRLADAAGDRAEADKHYGASMKHREAAGAHGLVRNYVPVSEPAECPKCGGRMERGVCECGYTVHNAGINQPRHKPSGRYLHHAGGLPPGSNVGKRVAELFPDAGSAVGLDDGAGHDWEEADDMVTANDKRRTCPECGGDLDDGECEDCGYVANAVDSDAHSATMQAAHASLDTQHDKAFGHAKDAVDASCDDDCKAAAKSHLKAAAEHDVAAEDSDMDKHINAAALHRKAALMHNRPTTNTWSDAAREAAARARGASKEANDATDGADKSGRVSVPSDATSEQHEAAGDEHTDAAAHHAREADLASESGDDEAQSKHEDAAEAHSSAAKAHYAAAKLKGGTTNMHTRNAGSQPGHLADAPREQVKAAFAHMATSEAAGSSKHTAEATAASKRAEKSGSAASYHKAAEKHTAAQKYHSKQEGKAHEDLAEAHGAAREHSIKMRDKAKGGTKNQAIVNALVEAGVILASDASVALNAIHSFDGSTDTPGKKVKGTQAGGEGDEDEYKLSGNASNDYDDDDDDDDNDDDDDDDGKVRNALAGLPIAYQEVLQDGLRARREAKLNIVRQLVGNMQNSAERKRLGDKYMKLSVNELRDMLTVVQNAAPQRGRQQQQQQPLQGLATFAGAAPTYNSFDTSEADDVLIPPTINYAELANFPTKK